MRVVETCWCRFLTRTKVSGKAIVLYLEAGTEVRTTLSAELRVGLLKRAMQGVKTFFVVRQDNDRGRRQRR